MSEEPRPETILLLPSHGLDDLPEDLPEPDAAGLLNAFALAWHPARLAAGRALPLFRRADQPPRPAAHRRFVVPECVRNRLPDGWLTDAADTAAVVGSDRAAGRAAVEAWGDEAGRGETADPSPFFALGLGHLWAERMTRRTHYYSTLDETRLRVEIVAAADARAAGDAAKLRDRLTEAAEILREARERFYPTPARFHDLVFVLPRLTDRLPAVVAAAEAHPVNLLATGADWRAVAETSPEIIDAVKNALNACVIGGEEHELPPALRDVTATLADLAAGRETFAELFGSPPKTWARRRFGFSPLTPQIAGQLGYAGAVRPNFGGGAFAGKGETDGGRGIVRWAGAEGELPCHTREAVPSGPAGSAAAWWRLPDVLADAFEQEQTVAVTFARWPGPAAPWLDDLKALTALSPVIGEFRTFDDLFAEPDPFARLLAADPRAARSRELEAAVAAGPGSHVAAARADALRDASERDDAVLDGLAGLIGAPPAGPESDQHDEEHQHQKQHRSEAPAEAAERLAALLSRGGGADPGRLWLNPLPTPCTVGVFIEKPPPAGRPAVRTVGPGGFTLDLPPGGFVWLPDEPAKGAPLSKAKAKTAEPGVVRNEFFEVHLDEATGGIASVKTYGRTPNRLGMRPCVRFAAPRSGRDGEPVWYADAVRTTWEVRYAGADRGEVQSTGELRDPAGGAVLATFKLSVRLLRRVRTAEVGLTLENLEHRPAGDPYADFLGVRWAWDDETADLTRSLQGTRQAAPAAGPFEAPHFFELATLGGETTARTAVLTGGAAFHARRGGRMCDTPLIVAGDDANETSWRFGIAVDDPHPMRAADAFLSNPAPVACPGPPASGPVGWLLACDAPGVRVLSLTPRADGSAVVRLQESDGRSREPRLRFFKPPRTAERRTLGGEPAGPLKCEGDAVLVPLAGYELCDVRVTF